jgi:adenine C2-methylase RlmN of 23S rRNA A2503 and tRNA A37
MIKLAVSFPQVRIALSLHSAIPEQRRQLVPRATANLDALQAAIAKVNQLQAPVPVWLEVVLFQGINDSPNHAEALLSFSRGLQVEANLIPYNPAANQSLFRAADRDTRERFARQLREGGLRTTIRTSFGKSNQAACGQLTTEHQVG